VNIVLRLSGNRLLPTDRINNRYTTAASKVVLTFGYVGNKLQKVRREIVASGSAGDVCHVDLSFFIRRISYNRQKKGAIKDVMKLSILLYE